MMMMMMKMMMRMMMHNDEDYDDDCGDDDKVDIIIWNNTAHRTNKSTIDVIQPQQSWLSLSALPRTVRKVPDGIQKLQYIPRNMHTVLLSFALLWLCNRS